MVCLKQKIDSILAVVRGGSHCSLMFEGFCVWSYMLPLKLADIFPYSTESHMYVCGSILECACHKRGFRNGNLWVSSMSNGEGERDRDIFLVWGPPGCMLIHENGVDWKIPWWIKRSP